MIVREVKNVKNIDIEKEVEDYLSYAYKNNIEPLLDKDGKGTYVYKFYADYRDELDVHDVANILKSDTPEVVLEELLWDSYDESRMEVLDELSDNAATYIEDKYRKAYRTALGDKTIELDDDERQQVFDIIEDRVCMDYDMDHYLDQDVNIDLAIDTGDGNYDYTLNCAYPAYGGSDTIDSHSSLAFLAESQGYSVEDLQKALNKGDVAYPDGFLESVRQEVANETSSINRLTVLLKMSLRDAIKVNERIREAENTGHESHPWERPDCGSLTIGKNATLGLFDPWNGGGSTFEIELEQDLELPIKYVHSALPDVKQHGEYSIQDVYGMNGSAWGEDLKSINEPKGRTEEQTEEQDEDLER
ncbi:hypothetical protein ACKX2L_06590 [Lachnospiraceae bacterium YH-ros2228]